MTLPLPPMHWDVVEAHLDEAAAWWTQRELTLSRPRAVLATLASGAERRLLAHLDGLRVGGASARERVLVPAVEQGEADLARPAAYVVLADGTPDEARRVLGLLQTGDATRRRAIADAAKLCPREDLDAALLAALPRSSPAVQAVLLDVLDFRQTDAGEPLETLGAGSEPGPRAAALRAARHAPWERVEQVVRLGLGAAEPEARDAALLAGLVHGRPEAWARCLEVVRAREPRPRLALLALALGGALPELALLVDALGVPELHEDALWALGFSGWRAAVDAIAEALEGPHAPLAAESLVAIAGLPPSLASVPPAGAEVPKREARSGSVSGARATASQVSPALLGAWWKKVRARFAPEARHLSGHPWTPEALLDALEHAPLGRRSGLALELAVRVRRAVMLETGTWVRRQRARLTQARGLIGQLRSGPFPSLWGG